MLTKGYIQTHGINAEDYINKIDEKYIEGWRKKYNQVSFSDEEIKFLKKSYLPINILVISGEWCPDCRNSVPILIKLSELCDYANVKILDRDTHRDKINHLTTNGGLRIPFVLFANQEYQEITRWVEKSTLVYEIILKAKKMAINEGNDDYGQYLREAFINQSSELFVENKNEIFKMFKKAVIMRTAAAKLDELKIEIAI